MESSEFAESGENGRQPPVASRQPPAASRRAPGSGLPGKALHAITIAMLLLAIETSSARGSLALFSDGGLVAEAVFPEGLVHGREITVHLRDLLAARGLGAARLRAIAVGVGPGSYTGIRVGVTAAKMLAFALQIPVIAESSMRVIAAGAASLAGADTAPSGGGLPVVVAIDGRQGQVYMSRHRVRVRSGPGGAAAGGAPLLEPEAAERVVGLPRPGSRTARGGEAVPPLPPAIPEAVRDELRRMVEPGVVVL